MQSFIKNFFGALSEKASSIKNSMAFEKKNLPVIVEISIVFAPARFIYFYIAKSQHPLNRCASNCLNKR